MNGAEPHNGLPAEFSARYQAPACAMIATGEAIPGPVDQLYYRTEDKFGPALLELDPSGNGIAIRNQWSDESGTYFFAAVSKSHAWLYVFPTSGALAPVKYVYPAGTYSLTEVGALLLPKGEPTVQCALEAR